MTQLLSARLGERPRAELCTIGRELMLAAHLQDRASIPAILRHHPMDEANDIAIDEWMTTSPIYTRRMQRLMGFEGDDVATILKGVQLEVGMPHQFMDAGFELGPDGDGAFWLRSCGALADVTPMGEDFVRGMCHDIEDPTFDATAGATNPRARMRPVHRPPGIPAGGPDCRWIVTIDEDAEPVEPHPELATMADSVVARLPNDPGPAAVGDKGGWDDYAGPFDPDFQLERLSHRALRIVAREFAVQGHLLARAMMTAVDRRHGRDEALEVGRALFTGIAWIAAERMARALGATTDVLPLTHLLLPDDYVGVTVTAEDDGRTVLTLADDAAGLAEGDPYSLPGLLAEGADEIIESLVHGVDPGASVEATTGSDGLRTWVLSQGADEPAVDEPAAVRVTRFSTGVTVSLRPGVSGRTS